jgi:hypothetical protein
MQVCVQAGWSLLQPLVGLARQLMYDAGGQG